MIPEIAIIGHPNEGKSSVLSTLAEDDSVRISPYPGETTRCRSYPVVVDNREILRFTDTPGFQNPARLLAELRTCRGDSAERLARLRDFTGSSPALREDHELLEPIARGAGIIYVVDGARPIRRVDRDEMEILRLLGRPRMAVINCKLDETGHLGQWKDELAQHFNSCRLFNAHRATYGERISLLETLKSIDQDWQQVLDEAIRAIEADWRARAETAAAAITSLLTGALSLELSEDIGGEMDEDEVKQRLSARYFKTIEKLEGRAHAEIRALFKHNIFAYQLPPDSLLHDELFSERTWQFLGLTKKQFVILAGIGGGAVGSTIELAALGHGFGLFTALGAAGGVLGALSGRKYLELEASLLGFRIAGPRLTIGPAASITLLFVLVNRALLFYRQVINWAHGRRDYPPQTGVSPHPGEESVTRFWSTRQLKRCHDFFKSARQPDSDKHHESTKALETLLVSTLLSISTDREPGAEGGP